MKQHRGTRRKRWIFEDWGRPKHKIENWGKKVFDKKTKNLFSGVGIAAVTAIAVIGLSAAILILARFVKQAIEVKIIENLSTNLQQINQATQPTQPAPQPTFTVPVAPTSSPTPALPVASALPTYTSVVFFSGVGWLNTASTTAYRDNNEAAMMFPPKYEWQPAGTPAGSPGAPQAAGVVTKIIQDGNQYKVLVYAPDGSPILTAANTPIVSDYPGSVGIGGTPDDFVVVYGSYWGAGARIVKTDGSWQVQDLSQFLGIRQMNGGFQPEIIRVENGAPAGLPAQAGAPLAPTWYIWSATPGNPKLIKLFTNGTGEIQGAIDLSQNLFTHGEKSAEFAAAGGEAIPQGTNGALGVASLVAKVVDASGAISYYQFTDLGFDKSQPLEVDSVNLNGFPIKISEATVSELGLFSAGADVSFYLSDDDDHWLPATVGEKVKFNKPTNQIFWRVVFGPSGDQFSSPFLTKVRLEYSGTIF